MEAMIGQYGPQNVFYNEQTIFKQVGLSFQKRSYANRSCSLVFNSNFAEGYSEHADYNQTPRTATRDMGRSPPTPNPILDEFEDSDNEDDGDFPAASSQQFSNSSSGIEEVSLLLADSNRADSDRTESEGTQSSDGDTSTSPALVLEPESYRDQSPALPKIKIVVKDAAYTTYRAMLYYVSDP